MIEFLQGYGTFWNVFETFAFLGVCALFFSDPIRRWNFLGYRPTAVMVVFDPKIAKLLLVRKENEPWFAFSQGGIYDPDLNFSSKEILKRELGLEEMFFSLRHTHTLGKVRIENREYNKRSRISTISIVRNLRGKGYIACYIRANLETVCQHITLGEDINEYRIVTLEEAQKILFGVTPEDPKVLESLSKKQRLLRKALKEVERIFANCSTRPEKKQKPGACCEKPEKA